MIYNARAYVDLERLAENYRNIKRAAGGTRVLCVVKADAYGHGAIEFVKKLVGEGADFFAVACLAEALEIRPYACNADIMILGYTSEEDADVLADNNIIQTVFSLEYAKKLSQNLGKGKEIECHMKFDSGMNRIGFRTLDSNGMGQLDEAYEAYNLDGLNFTGAFTHFACSDEPDKAMTEKQFKNFTASLDHLKKLGADFKIRHCSNSAAIFNYPEMRLDMVRAGIVLYGLAPSPETDITGCEPVMSLHAKISHIHKLYPGDSVSYGATYTSNCERTAATLTIGYADGFVRSYRNISVYINGHAAPIIGRICMDQCICDVSGIEGIKTGMDAVIFDREHTCDRLAESANTINYEVTSILTRRVKRIYI